MNLIKTIFALTLLMAMGACKPAKDSFSFEKMTFHSGPCFGVCPSYHMEIRNDQTVLLKGDSLYNRRGNHYDYGRVGFYSGRVADSTYRKLTAELRTIGLDTLRFKGPDCCDAPMKTLIIYYNGKRKYLRTMFPPDHARGLLNVLTEIYSKTAFEETSHRFEIEFDSLSRRK